MPILSRKACRPLLSQVKGKPHATRDDHEDTVVSRPAAALSSPPRLQQTRHASQAGSRDGRKSEAASVVPAFTKPCSRPTREVVTEEDDLPSTRVFQKSSIMVEGEEEDIFAPPDSSSEDELAAKDSKSGSTGNKVPPAGFKLPPSVVVETPVRKSAFQKPTAQLSSTENGKRYLDDEDMESEPEPDWMSKKPKIQHQNLHTKPSKRPKITPTSSQTPKLKAGYGASAKREQNKPKFKKTKEIVVQAPVKRKAAFKRADVMPPPPSSAQSSCQSTNSVDGVDVTGDSSPLSDLSDLEGFEDTFPSDPSTVQCTFCNERVQKFLWEEFEDTILNGKKMTYAWQRRFCTWHKQRSARELYRERGYPAEIDYGRLPRRMEKWSELLLQVLNDEVDSYHRNQFKHRAREGLKRQKEIVEEGSSKTIMGYYGPKGEKIMLEHIIHRYADDLRRRATRDKLVSASGLQGGVSGFVQVVLAPHLAELLVREDMGLRGDDWHERARAIISESAELGELLHPEEEEDQGGGGEDVVDRRRDQDDRDDTVAGMGGHDVVELLDDD